MADFTMTLEELVDRNGGTVEIVEGRTILLDAKIGLDHYPIFDEDYRVILNGYIYDRWMNYEIAYETDSQFIKNLRLHMAINGEYFAKMYQANVIEFDPLKTVNIESGTDSSSEEVGTTVGNSKAASDVNVGSRVTNNDMPQSALSRNRAYATSGVDNTGQTSTTTEGDENAKSESTGKGSTKSRSSGYSGDPALIIARYRESLIIPDNMVVESLSHLFMDLWTRPGSYT